MSASAKPPPPPRWEGATDAVAARLAAALSGPLVEAVERAGQRTALELYKEWLDVEMQRAALEEKRSCWRDGGDPLGSCGRYARNGAEERVSELEERPDNQQSKLLCRKEECADTTEAKLRGLEKQVQGLKSENERKTERVDTAEAKLQVLEKQFVDLDSKLGQDKQRADTLEAKLQELEKQFVQHVRALEGQLEDESRRSAQLRTQLSASRGRAAATQARLEARVIEVENAQAKQKGLFKSLLNMLTEVDAIDDTMEEVKHVVQAALSRIEQPSVEDAGAEAAGWEELELQLVRAFGGVLRRNGTSAVRAEDEDKVQTIAPAAQQSLSGTSDSSAQQETCPVTKQNARAGLVVVRGRDWKWAEQDGGAGKIGKLVEPCQSDGWWRVEWESGKRNEYRVGAHGGKYDLAAAGASAQAGGFVFIYSHDEGSGGGGPPPDGHLEADGPALPQLSARQLGMLYALLAARTGEARQSGCMSEDEAEELARLAEQVKPLYHAGLESLLSRVGVPPLDYLTAALDALEPAVILQTPAEEAEGRVRLPPGYYAGLGLERYLRRALQPALAMDEPAMPQGVTRLADVAMVTRLLERPTAEALVALLYWPPRWPGSNHYHALPAELQPPPGRRHGFGDPGGDAAREAYMRGIAPWVAAAWRVMSVRLHLRAAGVPLAPPSAEAPGPGRWAQLLWHFAVTGASPFGRDGPAAPAAPSGDAPLPMPPRKAAGGQLMMPGRARWAALDDLLDQDRRGRALP